MPLNPPPTNASFIAFLRPRADRRRFALGQSERYLYVSPGHQPFARQPRNSGNGALASFREQPAHATFSGFPMRFDELIPRHELPAAPLLLQYWVDALLDEIPPEGNVTRRPKAAKPETYF